MTEVSHKEHYCSICSLQFHSTYVFDMHLSLVHEGTRIVEGIACKKEQEEQHNFIKSESSDQNLEVKHGSVHEGRKLFYCDLCKKSFYSKQYVNMFMKEHIFSSRVIKSLQGQKKLKLFFFNIF